MRLIHALFFLSLAACASISNAVALTLERTWDRVVDLAREAVDYLRPDTPKLAFAGWQGGTALAGAGIDPALQHSLRHESAVPRYSANRSI